MYDPNNTGAPMNPQRNDHGRAQVGERYQFNAEELRILRQCNQDAFYQRALPLGTLFGLTTYSGVHFGILKPNPRWGAIPKVALAVFTGYFLGKVSYQPICAERMMALPNSPMGEILRRRKQQYFNAAESDTAMIDTETITDPSDNMGLYSDSGPSSMELDTTQPMQDIPPFGDTLMDNNYGDDFSPPESTAQFNTTYEELRRQNRMDYDKKRFGSAPVGKLQSSYQDENQPGGSRSSSLPSYGGSMI